MSHIHYKTRAEAVEQLGRLVGTWLEKDGSVSTRYEWMEGGNFMLQRVGDEGSSGLEVIGFDEVSGLLKTSFYASHKDMLDNNGSPIKYIYNIQGEDFEMALDMPDRHGSFVGKITDNDTKISGRWDWVQNGEKMGYDAILTKQQ